MRKDTVIMGKHLLRVEVLETLSDLFFLSFHPQSKDWKQNSFCKYHFILITWFTVKLDAKSKKYIMLSDGNHLLFSILLHTENYVETLKIWIKPCKLLLFSCSSVDLAGQLWLRNCTVIIECLASLLFYGKGKTIPRLMGSLDASHQEWSQQN